MRRWSLLMLLALCACHPARRKEPRTDAEYQCVPAGQAQLGCAGKHDGDCRPEERQRTVAMPELWLGRTEVTVDQYAKCVAATACSAEPMKRRTLVQDQNVCNGGEVASGPHPINCVTWSEAAAFCGWLGGRLPTADELEYAARGTERRIYPWGDQPPTDARARFNTGQGEPGTDAVALHPAGDSAFGIQDLAGNVAEWTSSDAGGEKEVRGGSWKDKPPALRSSARELRKPGRSDSGVGFRCAAPRW